MARGGWCRRIGSNGNTGLRLAKGGSVKELGGLLEAISLRE